MEANSYEIDDELTGILPVQPPSAAPAKKEFKAWHKPRKQYVRKHQWWESIQQQLPNIHFPADNRIFRYLTLLWRLRRMLTSALML